jgi:hypothetical protein
MSPQQAASTFMNYDVTYCHVFVIGHQIRDTEIVWQTTLTLPLFLFTSSKINHSNFFTLFISPQSFFIIIQIKKKKKKPLQNKIFSLFYKTFSNFISHQSLLTAIQPIISQHNYLPKRPIVFVTANTYML